MEIERAYRWLRREAALLWGEILTGFSIIGLLLALAMLCEGLRICP